MNYDFANHFTIFHHFVYHLNFGEPCTVLKRFLPWLERQTKPSTEYYNLSIIFLHMLNHCLNDTQSAEAIRTLMAEASKAINGISKYEITELRSLNNPPKGIQLVMEAICVLLVSDFLNVLNDIYGYSIISLFFNCGFHQYNRTL